MLALLRAEGGDDEPHGTRPGLVEGAGVVGRLPIAVRETDGVAERVDLPFALGDALLELGFIAATPDERRLREIGHEGVGVGIDEDAAGLAVDDASEQVAQAWVGGGEREVGPDLGGGVAQPHGLDVAGEHGGVGPAVEGAGLDGGVEGVGVAVDEELAELRVGDPSGALGEELLDGFRAEAAVGWFGAALGHVPRGFDVALLRGCGSGVGRQGFGGEQGGREAAHGGGGGELQQLSPVGRPVGAGHRLTLIVRYRWVADLCRAATRVDTMGLKLHRSLVRCILLLLMPVLARAQVRRQAPTPVRVADASCARCHAAIVRQYLASPKANASGMAAERLHAGSFQHAASGVNYKVLAAGGEAQLRYARAGAEPLAGSHALAYFLGSGHLGRRISIARRATCSRARWRSMRGSMRTRWRRDWRTARPCRRRCR